MASVKKRARKKSAPKKELETHATEYPVTPPEWPAIPKIRLRGGKVVTARDDVPELDCCRIKGYVWGSAETVVVAARNKEVEDRQLRAAADCHASVTGPGPLVDTGSDSGTANLSLTRRDEDYLVNAVKYTINWRFDDWCKSIRVVCSTSGDVASRQEFLPAEGSLCLSSATRYFDFNGRLVGALHIRMVAVDQTGDTRIVTTTIPAPPTV